MNTLPTKMHFDELMKLLGEFGRYQKLRFFMVCLFSIVSAWHALNMVFIGAAPKFHCKLSEYNLSGTSLENLTLSLLKKVFIPQQEFCQQYTLTTAESVYLDLVSNDSYNNQSRRTVTCEHGYEFSTSDYTSTITTEFNLVCENHFWISTSKSVFFAGRLCGAFVFGQLSDRFGRRPMFFFGCVLLLAAGLVASFAPIMEVFLPAYFCQGAAHTGAFLVTYTLSTELVGPRYRVMAGFISQGFYSIGFMSLAGIAYLVRDWRHLEIAITVPVVFFGLYWWFLPESVRWLLSHGKDVEAEKVLKAAARENGVSLDDNIIQALKEGQAGRATKVYTLLDLVNSWKMAKLSLNIWFCWLVNSLVYYGLSLNTGNLAGSPYINFCIAGAIEIPAYLICILSLNKFGRRTPLVISMYLGGVACILSGCVPVNGDSNLVTLTVVLAMIGKFGITASYGIVYLMAAELFPTVTRNMGMGVSSMAARVGGIIAPFFLELQSTHYAVPLILFGSLSLLSGSLALVLPDMTGKPLPQLPEDVDFGRSCVDIIKRRKPDEATELPEVKS